MALKIESSVGKKGINRSSDVKLVQALINTISLPQVDTGKLVVDGLSGPNTERAITSFQSVVVGMVRPDGRVDPGGRTFRALTANLTVAEKEKLRNSIASPGARIELPRIDQRRFRETAQKLSEMVVYHESVTADQRLVSEYSKKIIAIAALESGMRRAVITSTFRSYERQAELMLRNARVNLQAQYDLYGRFGEKVLDVYSENSHLTDLELLPMMLRKISELHSSGNKVSKHCVDPVDYLKYNVFDLGVNSNRAVNPGFNGEIFNGALRDLERQGFIADLIDERHKSNNCWHVEINVQAKAFEHMWDKAYYSDFQAHV